MAWCAGRQKAGRGWHTGGVIMGTTRGSGARRPRLEPDDEQSSRPVLRGLGLGNEARLPDTCWSRAADAPRSRLSLSHWRSAATRASTAGPVRRVYDIAANAGWVNLG